MPELKVRKFALSKSREIFTRTHTKKKSYAHLQKKKDEKRKTKDCLAGGDSSEQ